jgi:hypothetical protein
LVVVLDDGVAELSVRLVGGFAAFIALAAGAAACRAAVGH